MSTTLSHSLRLSVRAALATAIAVVGLAAITSTASATTTTLNSGTITLTDGSGTTDPPAGSWVHLPTDVSPPPPLTLDYFDNSFSSTWGGTPSGKYTLIRRNDSGLGNATGLELGTAQTGSDVLLGNTAITGDDTDKFGGTPWFLFTESGAAPELTFDDTTGALVSGDLTDLKVYFGGGTYDVSTNEVGAPTYPKHTAPLTGSIAGDPSIPGDATITLKWTSDLVEPGFNNYRAHFQLVGTYN